MKGTNKMNDKKNNKIEIETLVKTIIDLQTDKDMIMERELATPKLMRQLYKALGEPNIADYPDIYNHIRWAKKEQGYTKSPLIYGKYILKNLNGNIDNNLKKMSPTKERIVDSYSRDGWNCTVYAFNVICSKYVQHKDYDNVGIRFVSTRDTARYEYVLFSGE